MQPQELEQIEIEISVLTVPERLTFSLPKDLLNQLQPHRDCDVLQVSGQTATSLPQVWSQILDKVTFLNSLAEKAGVGAEDWRGPDTKVLVYHVESFRESEVTGADAVL